MIEPLTERLGSVNLVEGNGGLRPTTQFSPRGWTYHARFGFDHCCASSADAICDED